MTYTARAIGADANRGTMPLHCQGAGIGGSRHPGPTRDSSVFAVSTYDTDYLLVSNEDCWSKARAGGGVPGIHSQNPTIL